MGIVMVEAEAVIVVAEEATGAEEGGGISIGVGWCLQFYPERVASPVRRLTEFIYVAGLLM